MAIFDSQSIREAFVNFFITKGHTSVARSSLVPDNDPTLLFTNSGMVQFKDVFLGSDTRSYARATTVQPSVRAGGKHNDLDNVGYTARHHTFFEMLGNFSFGDYFKKEAIHFAWGFLTEVLKIPKEKLWVTVYEKDDEAADIWLNQIGVSKDRLSRIGTKDNFWQMGDTGPCGPCTEIFYDHGDAVFGGPPGSPDADGDRYIEIWNLVFMQYEKDASGNLTPLPKPSVDTGMGLERLAAILQGVHDNYEIDSFVYLINQAADILNLKLASLDEKLSKSLRVIADHIRSTSFLITDGVMPSNEGRGYVLRRIIRRAIRHGEKLGAQDMFFYKLVQPLVNIMGQAYPELKANKNLIEEVLKSEESQFLKTLAHGLKILNQALEITPDNKIIPGDLAFRLYDTYGFPLDLTQDLARERNLLVDLAGFDKAMEVQRQTARSASEFKNVYQSKVGLDLNSVFLGYECTEAEALVTGIFPVPGHDLKTILILDQSPFYAESGGQIGDVGLLENETFKFEVQDTQKHGNAIAHYGKILSGNIHLNEVLTAKVDFSRRAETKRNHSATHLLDSALIEILGSHVIQKGSLVKHDRLRFDFSHPKALTQEELDKIENRVNQVVLANLNTETIVTDPESAKKMGAIGLFGEKYGATVRVVKMGDFSMEFCGGTHVSNTGEIGLFKIISESSVASGIRRIEAVTGLNTLNYLRIIESQRKKLSLILKSSPDVLLEKVEALVNKKIILKEKGKDSVKTSGPIELMGDKFLKTFEKVKLKSGEEIDLLMTSDSCFSNLDVKILRSEIDKLKLAFKKSVIVLALPIDKNKLSLFVGVSDSLTSKIKANELIGFLSDLLGAKGGGRADFAQAGGSKPENIAQAFIELKKYLENLEE